MADSPDTVDTVIPSRLSFSSLNAAPPRRRSVAVLPAVVAAHHDLIEALAVEVPHAIVGYAADRFDILERAEHLKAVLVAVTSYAKAIVKDTIDYSPVAILDETVGLVDNLDRGRRRIAECRRPIAGLRGPSGRITQPIIAIACRSPYPAQTRPYASGHRAVVAIL